MLGFYAVALLIILIVFLYRLFEVLILTCYYCFYAFLLTIYFTIIKQNINTFSPFSCMCLFNPFMNLYKFLNLMRNNMSIYRTFRGGNMQVLTLRILKTFEDEWLVSSVFELHVWIWVTFTFHFHLIVTLSSNIYVVVNPIYKLRTNSLFSFMLSIIWTILFRISLLETMCKF